MITNRFYLLLDASTSMNKIREQTITAFNNIAEGIKKNAKKRGQKTFVTLQTFSTFVHKPLMFNVPADQLQPLMWEQYCPDGWTAMWDAETEAIRNCDQFDKKNADVSFVIICVTDGEPNQNKFATLESFKRLMNARGENWSFVFQVPKDKKLKFHLEFGIPLGNIKEWEQTDEGTQEMSDTTNDGITQYFDDRAKGARGTKTFFSQVDPNAKEQLENLAGKYRVLTVDDQSRISSFVEDMMGSYTPGSTFYQLMKPETVEEGRGVLLMEKGKRTVYGGPQARGLIGLPNTTVRVKPGNHDNYDVFIQSRSHTRILSRGTRVLVAK